MMHNDLGSHFPGYCCLCMEQFNIICHVIVVTVDFQALFENVFVRNILVTLILVLLVFQ